MHPQGHCLNFLDRKCSTFKMFNENYEHWCCACWPSALGIGQYSYMNNQSAVKLDFYVLLSSTITFHSESRTIVKWYCSTMSTTYVYICIIGMHWILSITESSVTQWLASGSQYILRIGIQPKQKPTSCQYVLSFYSMNKKSKSWINMT